MLRRLLLLLVIMASTLPGRMEASDPVDFDAWLTYPLHLRSEPTPPAPAIQDLPAGTGLTLTGRTGNTGWLLGDTDQARGWIPAEFVSFRQGFDPTTLPISHERVNQGDRLAENGPGTDIVDIAATDPLFVQTRAAAIRLDAYPILPESTAQARATFERGQQLGRSPAVISKIGDCNSTEWLFLYPFGEDQYDLGPYTDLQGVIDQFGASFSLTTYAAYNGLNAAAVLDPVWSNPEVCQPGETPLDCELRVHNASVAVIMFGTNDLIVLSPEEYDAALRHVLNLTLQTGTIPVLSTFPRHLAFPERSILYNQIVVRVALDYDIPLVNLWLALEPLPMHGIDDDEFHLNGPITRAGDLSSESNLQTGSPLRNLITLQALDVIWRQVMQ
jgi:hypothetical protein